MKRNILIACAILSTLLAAQSGAENLAVQSKSSVLQCLDRKIELKADCLPSSSPLESICTRQSLSISNDAGQKLGERLFTPVSRLAPPQIEEKVSALICTETPGGDKYIVARMDNGGNCDACEWAEVFAWNGAVIGSDRDKKSRNKAVKEATDAAFGEGGKKIIQKKDLGRFYRTSAK